MRSHESKPSRDRFEYCLFLQTDFLKAITLYMDKITKPKLVFFQFKHDKNLAEFVLLHRQQHVKCLSEFFEVIVINKDCDYKQICDLYQPDIALFESGVNYSACHRLKIENTSAYPEILKIGFHNGDPWCDCRSIFLADMDNWGIDTFFSIGTTATEYMPEIAEHLFIWPNFIDADLYRDYGESKIIPILFTGNITPLYPWRQRIKNIIEGHYPSELCPHKGWAGKATAQMLYGEQYARKINASWFVPTCGTMAKIIVRKHFEIPASKSCLIAERTPSVEAAGFVDMQNCVLAEDNDILDKLDYLFQNLDELEQIIDAGYKLVHSRHTLKQRDQIFQWFNLKKTLKVGQKIIQKNPFESLIIVNELLENQNSTIVFNGLDRILLHQGDEKLWSSKYDEAEALYLKCLNYAQPMPEPKLRLALCSLYKGNASVAYNWIFQPIQWTLQFFKASEPDPVEWAYLIISLLCQGRLKDAILRAEQFPLLHHAELDRVRWVINILQNRVDESSLPEFDISKYRYSIHQLPPRNFYDWFNELLIMLQACQQFTLLEYLSISINPEKKYLMEQKNLLGITVAREVKYFIKLRIIGLKILKILFEKLSIYDPDSNLPPISEIGYIILLARWFRLNRLKSFFLKLNTAIILKIK